MYWHIDTDIVSLIVLAAVYVYFRRLSRTDDAAPHNRRFLRCLVVGIFVTVVDIAASVIMEVPTTRFLYHLLMTLYFISLELGILEWFLYVLTILFKNGERGEKAIRYSISVVYFVYAAFVCLNPWTGAIYRLGSNNEYERGPLFWVMLVLYAAYTLALFCLILIRWKRIPRGYPGGVLLATPLIIAVGIVAQLAIPGSLLIMPTYMICLILAFLFLQNMQLKNNRELVRELLKVAETDVLTGLYNRTGMEAMAQKTLDEAAGQNVLVLIVDIDDLKQINDTLGHAGGDKAIRLVATQLRRHFRANDTVVRYGGDEFLAFFTGDFTQEQLNRIIEPLVAELGAICLDESSGMYLHCSIGAAYGVVGQDSFISLCNRADTALYYVKRNGKNSHAFYRQEMEDEQFAHERSKKETLPCR